MAQSTVILKVPPESIAVITKEHDTFASTHIQGRAAFRAVLYNDSGSSETADSAIAIPLKLPKNCTIKSIKFPLIKVSSGNSASNAYDGFSLAMRAFLPGSAAGYDMVAYESEGVIYKDADKTRFLNDLQTYKQTYGVYPSLTMEIGSWIIGNGADDEYIGVILYAPEVTCLLEDGQTTIHRPVSDISVEHPVKSGYNGVYHLLNEEISDEDSSYIESYAPSPNSDEDEIAYIYTSTVSLGKLTNKLRLVQLHVKSSLFINDNSNNWSYGTRTVLIELSIPGSSIKKQIEVIGGQAGTKDKYYLYDWLFSAYENDSFIKTINDYYDEYNEMPELLATITTTAQGYYAVSVYQTKTASGRVKVSQLYVEAVYEAITDIGIYTKTSDAWTPSRAAYQKQDNAWNEISTTFCKNALQDGLLCSGELSNSIPAGLYDSNYKLIASWKTLRDTYGMDYESDYTESTYKTNSHSPYNVLKNNAALANGSRLALPDSITEIGDYAFAGCSSLTNISIPGSVLTIGDYAFSSCSKLSTVTLAEGLTTIGDYAFYNSALSSIVIPDTVLIIDNAAFYGCTNLKKVILGSALMVINQYTFYGCSALTDIFIPSNIRTISKNAFEACSSLAAIVIAEGLTFIEESAFQNCSGLKHISIPNSTTFIAKKAFSTCNQLTSVTLGTSNTSIRTNTFEMCTALTTIRIEDTLQNIEASAFYGCSSLTSIIFNGTVETWNSLRLATGWNDATSDYVIYCTNGKICKNHIVVTDYAVAATCTASGLTEGSHCSVCNNILVAQEAIDALGHTEVVNKAVAPTCTATGLTEGKHCSRCNATLSQQLVLPATGHTKTAIPAVAPTCTTSGLTEGSKCSICKEILVEQEEIPALGHDEEVIPGQAATCTEDGLTEGKKCKVCKTILAAQEVIQADGHKYKTIMTSPTCTNKGFTTFICTVCNDSYNTDEIAALGHKDIDIPGEAPTCTEPGITAGKMCVWCEEISVAQEVIPATGHSHNAVITAPTCTEKGYTTYTCDCGDTYTDNETAALGHTSSDAVIENNIDPTCTVNGSYDNVVYCTVCNIEISRTAVIVDALGHNLITVAGQAATCTDTGYTDYKYCSLCDYIEGKEEIPATGHDYKEVVTAPTCTTKGYTTYTCSKCNDTYIANEVAALGHTEVVDAAVAATCTATGKTEGKHCSVCNEVLVAQTTIPALGHTEVIIPAVEATCTTTGLTAGKQCAVCNTITVAQTTVDALGHAEVAHEAKTPTCTENGWDAYVTCSRCDYTTYSEKAALGHVDANNDYECDVCHEDLCVEHTEEAIPAVAPTCTTTGLTAGTKCSICGDIIVAQETVAALGHTEVVDARVEPTCTTTGLTEGKHCSVCNAVLVAQTTVPATGHTYVDGECHCGAEDPEYLQVTITENEAGGLTYTITAKNYTTEENLSGGLTITI